MASHSNNLAWEIPWTEEPGGLQYIGVTRVGNDQATKQQFLKLNPTQRLKLHLFHFLSW